MCLWNYMYARAADFDIPIFWQQKQQQQQITQGSNHLLG